MKKNNFEIQGLQVKVLNNNIEKALKIFKRKVKDSEIMLEMRKRSFYEKPSDKKRRKRGLSKLRGEYRTQKQNN